MYYVIANEKHLIGKGAKNLDEVKKVFDAAGRKYEVLLTHREGDAKAHAEAITSSPSDEMNTLIAMGGDGTLHDLINGIKDFDNCALGLIPLGTGNDFAASAGIPTDVKAAAEIIAFRDPQFIDYIQLSSGLRSINAVGMGIDVDVLKRTYAGKSQKRSKYLKALISSLVHFKSCNFTVKYNGKEEKHFGLIAAVGNGKQFGGGIKLFPDAEIDDGYLDMFIVDYISKRKIPAAFIKLMRGKVNSIKEATAVRVKEVEFIADSENFTIQAEGELYENVPINAHIVSDKLKFYLPEKL